MNIRYSILILLPFQVLYTIATIQYPPRIVKQPPPDELLFQVKATLSETDKPFIIECEAEAEPAPKYRWIKNGKKFDWQAYDDRISQQPGRGTLVIAVPKIEDVGQYQCFAENEWGIATSNNVFVRRAELNSFRDAPPVLVQANEGEPFNLTCQPPDGYPKPNVYWLIQNTDGTIKSINNSRITIDPEGNLWFSNITRFDASDSSWYACSATSVFRNEYKLGNRIILDVTLTGVSASTNKHEPVLQYVSRRNEVVNRGKRIELFCIFGGTPLPQTFWFKDGVPIRSTDRLTTGNYGKSLIIKHATFEDKGTYTCDVSNGIGEQKSYSINLDVRAAPYFTVEPEIVNAAEGETVEIRCEASGKPEPEVKWIHNGKPIDEAPPNPRRRILSNKIIIEDILKKDTGNYGCNATNAIGYVYKDVYVNVLALPPDITEPPTNLAVVDGQTITMTCRVFGAPKPEVKWLRNSIELTGGRYNVSEAGDLQITDVSFSDAGDYTCYASNKFGATEEKGSLIVKEHTKITDAPEDYEVPAGTIATFRCNAVSDPTLDLEIIWLKNDQPIDFEAQPRFVRTSDYSLTVTKTNELDSGTYTCLARTQLDNVSEQATLTVQDVPNAPVLLGVTCNKRQSQIRWQPMGDNRAPILRYTIQYNTSFTPDSWDVAYDSVPAIDTTYNVPLTPWANYTFRIIAWNKIGPSLPSGHSSVCTTQPEIPNKNPDNVEGKGSEPNNMVISWTIMPQIEHYGPGFMYRVSYKLNQTNAEERLVEITNWRQDYYIVNNTPTFQPYIIKVTAANKLGESNVAAKEVTGWSGEAEPLRAPTNLTLTQINTATSAMLQWNPVDPETVRGHFKGYKIQTWTDKDGEENLREIHVKGEVTRALVTKFVPNTKNYVRVLAFNGRYNGPPSEILSFDTPEGVPGPVPLFEAYPLGPSAFYLVWKEPEQPNGVLTGYKIYYQVIKDTEVDALRERDPQINNPRQTRCKLAGLNPSTNYRIHIRALTKAGEGDGFFIEETTKGSDVQVPDIPIFRTEKMPTDNGLANIKVIWMPNTDKNAHPGSHFFVKYRLQGDPLYESTPHEINEDYIEVRGLLPGEMYEFRVVAVDGNYMTESELQRIDTYDIESPIIQPKENVATAGWFIGMMLAIAFLLLVLIVVCIVKRNRGGKYAVHEREQANGRRDYQDEGGFHEYSQPLDNKSHGNNSLSSGEPAGKLGNESDEDSMAEYGEGDTEGMNEDGSFIGQYGRQRSNKPGGETYSQGFATLV